MKRNRTSLIFVLVLVGVLAFSGCQFLRRAAITISEEDLKNAATARIIAKNCMTTWDISSGFVRKALGVSIVKLPQEAVDAIDALDALTESRRLAERGNLAIVAELTDREVGEILGYKAMIASSIVRRILKDYAPDIFNLIPAFFL